MACPLLVVSPHLDDAVFGCGGLLAASPGAQVVTVFASCEGAEPLATEWDRGCGFASAAEAVAARREEDRAALQQLEARPAWLGFCDAQYGRPPSLEAVVVALQAVLERHRPARVLMPLGLYHSDHLLASAACLVLLSQAESGQPWLDYEDALYRRMPGLVQARLGDLEARGFTATPEFPPCGELCRKQAAAACYRSQLGALARAGHAVEDELAAPERCWRLQAAAELHA